MNANFIFEDYIDDITLCDDLIEYHMKSPNKKPGQVVNYGQGFIDKNIKDSIDVILYHENDLFNRYLTSLKKVADKYIEKYHFCNAYGGWGVVETINIQHYNLGGGFKPWHTERVGSALPNSNRHLVFMTYLNDVTDRGETEFFYQNKKVNPKKGLTLIWPADWTHTHRGIPSLTQEKYIITGWFNFM